MYQHVSTINMSFHLPMLSESHFDSKRGCSRGIRVRQSWPTQPLWDQHQGVCRPWQGVFLRCWPMACWASGVYDGVFMIHNGLLKILVLLLLFYINIYLCMCVCRCLPAMASLQEACVQTLIFHHPTLWWYFAQWYVFGCVCRIDRICLRVSQGVYEEEEHVFFFISHILSQIIWFNHGQCHGSLM